MLFFSKDELHLPVEVTHGYVGKLFIKQEHRLIGVTIIMCHPLYVKGFFLKTFPLFLSSRKRPFT